jgi:hypothetical protein
MAITKPIYLTEAQLNKVATGNFPDSVKAQASDMIAKIEEEKATINTWEQLEKAFRKMKQSVITPDKLIQVMQNNGWTEPTS